MLDRLKKPYWVLYPCRVARKFALFLLKSFEDDRNHWKVPNRNFCLHYATSELYLLLEYLDNESAKDFSLAWNCATFLEQLPEKLFKIFFSLLQNSSLEIWRKTCKGFRLFFTCHRMMWCTRIDFSLRAQFFQEMRVVSNATCRIRLYDSADYCFFFFCAIISACTIACNRQFSSIKFQRSVVEITTKAACEIFADSGACSSEKNWKQFCISCSAIAECTFTSETKEKPPTQIGI